jgi:hypothetical protein
LKKRRFLNADFKAVDAKDAKKFTGKKFDRKVKDQKMLPYNFFRMEVWANFSKAFTSASLSAVFNILSNTFCNFEANTENRKRLKAEKRLLKIKSIILCSNFWGSSVVLISKEMTSVNLSSC